MRFLVLHRHPVRYCGSPLDLLLFGIVPVLTALDYHRPLSVPLAACTCHCFMDTISELYRQDKGKRNFWKIINKHVSTSWAGYESAQDYVDANDQSVPNQFDTIAIHSYYTPGFDAFNPESESEFERSLQTPAPRSVDHELHQRVVPLAALHAHVDHQSHVPGLVGRVDAVQVKL